MSSPSLGFIGLGAMGEPMVAALLRAGFAVTVCAHRRREPLVRLLGAGAAEAADPRAVAEQSDIVMTCVPDAPQVRDALFGERGALFGARRGALFIDTSTIAPAASREIAARLHESAVRFLDAPLSGGPVRAKSGSLTIMVGGPADDFRQARPVFSALGTAYHVGGVGLGETVKLVNQLIIACVMVANAEALTFAQRAGADLEAVRAVLATATASNYLLEQWLPKTWFAGTFEGGFAMDLLRKDVGAALDAAREMRMPMPAAALAYQLYTLRSAQGDGTSDYSAVVKFYEHVAGK